MRKINKPWGYEIILEKNKYYVIKHIHVNKGHRTSWQYHKKKFETFLGFRTRLLSTSTTMTTETIKPLTEHRITGPCDVIEVSSPHLNDIVRLEDDYGRK